MYSPRARDSLCLIQCTVLGMRQELRKYFSNEGRNWVSW